MKSITISAASYVDLQLIGNDRTGLRPWPDVVDWTNPTRAWDSIRWSELFKTDCPRFSRADPLCKLALISVELLDLRLAEIPEGQRENLGVCLGTRWGSLSTDCRFLRTGSPSEFIYSLPSTAIGEICIRHKLKGPMRCFMYDRDGDNTIVQEAEDMLHRENVQACLCVYCDAIVSSVPESLSPTPRRDHGLAAAVLVEKGPMRQAASPGHALALPIDGGWVSACRQFCVDRGHGGTQL